MLPGKNARKVLCPHRKKNTKLPIPSTDILTESEGAWFASILNIGALIGCLLAGGVVEKYGRKATLLVMTLPYMTGWALIGTGQNIMILYIGSGIS